MASRKVHSFYIAVGFVALICAGSAALATWCYVQDLPQHVQTASAGMAQPVAPYTFDGMRIVRR